MLNQLLLPRDSCVQNALPREELQVPEPGFPCRGHLTGSCLRPPRTWREQGSAALLLTSAKTPMENQEWKKHPPCFPWAPLVHCEQPRKCVMGMTRCLPGQGTFLQAKSLEPRLFFFIPFLRASCLQHSPSLQSPVYLSTSNGASSALLRILANSGREMWPPHVGSN